MTQNNITNKRELAKSTFKAFVRQVYQLLAFNQAYSLMVGAGNSGLAMAEMTKLIYEYLDKQVPEIIRIPFDRSVLDSRKYACCIVRPSAITEPNINVLFVDDEIGPGTTAATCFDITSEIIDPHKISKYTIVAEDHPGDRRNLMNISPTLQLQLFQPKKSDSGFTNVVSCLVPADFSEDILTVISQKGDGLSCKIEMNILLGLPIKSQENGHLTFSYQDLRDAEKNVHDLDTMRNSFKECLKHLIAEAISESKTETQSGPQAPKPQIPRQFPSGRFSGF